LRTSVSLPEKIVETTDKIVENRLLKGVKDRSGVVEVALLDLFEKLQEAGVLEKEA
jgi:metal-responsive CopG/Arc/MetJ family transcriptional regulator